MDSRELAVRRSFVEQAALCEQFGSPFTSRLLSALESSVDRSTATGSAILDWSGPAEATGDALALRIAGALHAIARSGDDESLKAIYPPNPLLAQDQLGQRVSSALKRHDRALLPWLQFAPQTNEVGRSAALYLGLMETARHTGLPLRLFEIGSSAGINLMLDRYQYRFGSSVFGASGSTLTLSPEWEGETPDESPLTIISRQGCDLAPLQVSDPEQRRRLEAYVWPDQEERHRRLAAAIDIVAEDPPTIEQADAVDWVRRTITDDREEGSVAVLMHSLTFTYLSPDSRQKIRTHLETLGRAATRTRPIAWLGFELDDRNQAQLRLRLWPDGSETLLAEAHPHCRHIRWL